MIMTTGQERIPMTKELAAEYRERVFAMWKKAMAIDPIDIEAIEELFVENEEIKRELEKSRGTGTAAYQNIIFRCAWSIEQLLMEKVEEHINKHVVI